MTALTLMQFPATAKPHTRTHTHTHTHTHWDCPTVIGAGCSVFGTGLADDVLVDLVPFVLIVTPGEKQKCHGISSRKHFVTLQQKIV